MIKIPVILPVILSVMFFLSELHAEYEIQPDKKLHLEAGIIIGAGSYFICPAIEEFIVDRNVIHPVVWSIAMASIAGAGKEIVYDDMMGRGCPDRKDFYYTAAGGLISGVTLGITEYIFKSNEKSVSLQADPFKKTVILSSLCRF